jgi:hypothetical protein
LWLLRCREYPAGVIAGVGKRHNLAVATDIIDEGFSRLFQQLPDDRRAGAPVVVALACDTAMPVSEISRYSRLDVKSESFSAGAAGACLYKSQYPAFIIVDF